MRKLDYSRRAEVGEGKTERTYYRDIDQASVEQLARVYREAASPERLGIMAALPTKFEPREAFERSYHHATGGKPSPEITGFSEGLSSPAHVSAESPHEVPEITMHERVHQLSHPHAAELLGPDRYEGMTQELALKALERETRSGEATAYPEQTAFAHRLRARCGDGAVETLYFQGDASELRACLDRSLGPDGAEQLRKRLSGSA